MEVAESDLQGVAARDVSDRALELSVSVRIWSLAAMPVSLVFERPR